MTEALAELLERITGRRPGRMSRLSGGCIAETYKVETDGGEAVVVKRGQDLALEGWMLTYLAGHSRLPVPEVLHAEDDLLVMSYIDGGGVLGPAAQHHAADLLAALHGTTAPTFGLERHTLIGGLHQPNPAFESWVEFFRDQRLLYMAHEASKAGQLPAGLLARLEAFAARLGNFIGEPAVASLLHGDMWGGNILVDGEHVAGFVDPAIYYGDPEIELAFSTLFGTFGNAFFGRYTELRPIEPGFFETRRAIYNLYPLLVHVRLFGGSYVPQVDGILKRFE